MIKKVLFVALIATFSSCNIYTVSTFQPDQNNGSDCPNPIYVATIAKSAISIVGLDSQGKSIESANQKSMTILSLIEDARKIYGNDVTIHNIRWDVKNRKKKTGVVYDVIKCK